MGTEETANKEGMPMRKVWVINETSDSNSQFAENLSLLGDALHMELELVKTEVWIGSCSGDILADDKKCDAAIVLEHHSGETEHYQLGQVLACAENYNASILIWLADNFREEHRSALDWLNRWMPEEVEVYGVEIRGTEKDDADANPEFVPVVAPASWTKHDGSRPIPKIQSVALREFFQPLVDELRNEGFTKRKRAIVSRYQPFPSGVSSLSYIASLELDGRCWVYIPGGTSNLNTLVKTECRQKIESELNICQGTKIAWHVPSSGSMGVHRKGSLNDPEEEIAEIRQWMSHYLLKFKEVFNPRMKKILAELETADE